MKTTLEKSKRLCDAARLCAVALMTVALTASASAQEEPGSIDPGPSQTPSTSPSAPGPYDSPGAMDPVERRSSDTDTDTDTSSLRWGDKRFITKSAKETHKELALSQLAAERATNPEVRSYAEQVTSEDKKIAEELVQLAASKGVQLDNAEALLGSSPADADRSSSGSGVTGSTNAGVATDNSAPRATGAAGTAGTGASSGMATNESTATSGPDASRTVEPPADRQYRSLSRKTDEEFDKNYVDIIVDKQEDEVKRFEKAASDAKDEDVRAFASRHLPTQQAQLERANGLMQTTTGTPTAAAE